MQNNTSRFDRTTRLRYPKFTTIGDTIAGEVLQVEDQTVPEFDANNRIVGPKFDVNGELVKQPAITIRTDDGQEHLVRAGAEMSATIGAALATAGYGDLVAGDHITITHTGTEPSESGEFEVKTYTVVLGKRPKA